MNQDPFTDFQRLATEADSLARDLNAFRQELNRVLEQNAELMIENKHLRGRLDQLSGQNKQIDQPEMLPSRRNLEKLYDSGFHICNEMYGARRENNEPCAFCTSIIYGNGDRTSSRV
ncbi:MAG TPA: DNA replication initiation control protein YabA [Lapidilactobacillus dextrinicus]|jgi:regulator of replication initiation timing|uniref:DNA replication initiation control protein YabA n=1 Tax=Lapidilactobacillus dextrinicus TaxID=51664 RepID=A0A921DVJ3_9LACO|nr:DNA replication initiation control protein YabA [Lapidilactobacillus dextrinicus]HJE15752.1 DNA replication initiation control protein YabA [Lapidilactobacillus dextrinicus]